MLNSPPSRPPNNPPLPPAEQKQYVSREVWEKYARDPTPPRGPSQRGLEAVIMIADGERASWASVGRRGEASPPPTRS